ncbi:MAG: lamin tail domain-containing protein [Chloroflexi bacterium]|nr:lamin tail domain-containing protein [Chloroflexota bacterium]
MRRWIWLLLLVGFLPRTAAAHNLCFVEVSNPYCLEEPFSDYWEDNGGLPVFGYPIAAAKAEANPDTGMSYHTQWLERNRFEVHPENAGTAYEVLLGLLGKERLQQLAREADPREAGPQAGCLWFEETGHNVCDQANGLGFKSYWQSHGLKIPGLDTYARSLQLFGLPLTGVNMETNANGDTVQTQWFERARLEWHPNNPDQFKVLLGLLGKEVYDNRWNIPQPMPTPTPIVTPTPAPPPPSFNNCQADPTVASNFPVRIVSVDKGAETVVIQNVSNAPVAIDGWKICSIRGNQLHTTLGGSLAAGETRTITSTATGPIWNNNDDDDASLYDAEGRLISFLEDEKSLP